MNLERRPGGEVDRAIVRGIHHRAFREVVERQFGAWDESMQDRFFDAEWDRQAHEVIVINDEPAGYVAVERFDDHVFVHNIVLDPGVHGRGIGTLLLREILSAAEADSQPVRLQVLRENRAAGLYRRLGFMETGRTPTHVIMEWAPD